MNYRMVAKVLGSILVYEALLMILPTLVSLYYDEASYISFIISIILMLAVGIVLKKTPLHSKSIKIKEGFAIVSLGWILSSLFGCLPYIISGAIPAPVDAFFEAVSGYTTTGASILTDLSSLPRGILFWRSFTHWIGGIGILVFSIALLPTIGASAIQIFRAEIPGSVSDKLVPKIKDTAKILYITYLILTAVETILLMFGGLSLYEALIYSFGTVGTGGCATTNAGVAAFNSTYVTVVISIFMLLSGISFFLYYDLLKGRFRNILKNEELHFYLLLIFAAVFIVGMNIDSSIYYSFGESFKQSFFQVTSIITTTGYAATDFDTWPTFSKTILFILMFTGGCAGSSGGGIKQIRLLLIFKLVKREFQKIFHSHAMIPIKVNSRSVPSDAIANASSFFILYIFLFVAGTALVSLENISMISAASTVAASLSNIGVGFELIGPMQNFSFFSAPTKLFLSFLMLAGRLELFTILTLLSPSFWKTE